MVHDGMIRSTPEWPIESMEDLRRTHDYLSYSGSKHSYLMLGIRLFHVKAWDHTASHTSCFLPRKRIKTLDQHIPWAGSEHFTWP